MPGFIDNTLRSIQNGIVSVSDFAQDIRLPNRIRPRIQASDPTTAIDTQENTQILSFPSDRGKYFISFAFEEYRRPNIFEGLSSAGLTDYISLPIPSNLVDSNILNWTPEEGNFLIESATRSTGEIGDAYRTGGINGVLGSLNNLGNQAGETATGWGVQRMLALAKGALSNNIVTGPNFVDGALQLMGLADNPFATVGFKGPTFKQHKFSWRLIAKSRAETIVIKKIKDTFKKVAYPEILSAAAGGFYKYPHICWPKFHPDSAREYLYNFKPCVIQEVNIDFSPNFTANFFAETSAPVNVQINLSLIEIELWRNGDGNRLVDGEFPTISTGDFNDVESPPIRNLGVI